MTTVQTLPITGLVPSPTNPRKHFAAADLAELAKNILEHGVLQPLLVRPLPDGRHEIVAGERRYRAALEAKLAGVPCTIRNLSDVTAFEIQLVENLQRTDLTPIEEAEGFGAALQLTLDGKRVHTVETLAGRIGKDPAHIYRRLKLLDLPVFLRAAVDAGILPVRQAVAIARIPDPDKREEAGKEVLHGHGENQPLNARETEDLLRSRYMRELKGAPFDQEDGSLVADMPAASRPADWSGRCSDCPHRSGNIPGFEGKRTDLCTSPSCYEYKAAHAFERAAEAAAAAGRQVLAEAEARKHFDALGKLTFATTLVRPSERPAEHLLKREVKQAPRWSDLASTAEALGIEVVRYVARNPVTGCTEDLLDSAGLIAIAEKLGEPIFRTAKSEAPVPVNKRPGEDENDAFRRGQREAKARQEAEAVAAAEQARRFRLVRATAIRAVHAGLVKRWVMASVWDVLLDYLVEGEQPPGNWHLLHELFSLRGGIDPAAIRKAVLRLPAEERQAAVPLLMLAGLIVAEGIANAGLKVLAKHVGVDLRAIERDVLRAETAKAKVKQTVGAAAPVRRRKAAAPKPSPAKKPAKGKRPAKPSAAGGAR
jgi:ParB/RepB/Spo0J family partition protein